MSDVFTKRRPMIDLDEFERRLCRPCSTDQTDGEPLAELAELLRIVGSKDESHDAQVRPAGGNFAAIEAGLLGTKQPQAAIPSEAERSTVEDKRPNPLISGDFAAIEAGLLGIPREQATAAASEANMSIAFSSGDIGSQRFLHQDNQLSRHARVAGGQNRSRRPLYGMVAIIIVAMAGIAVGFGLKSRVSGAPEIASIKADEGPDKQQTEATSSANVPAQEAAILSKPPEPSPMAPVKGAERTLDLPQVEEKTLPAESHAQIDDRPPAVPSAPAQAQTLPAEPLSMAALIGPEKMKTDLVRPDATLPPNDTLPQANVNEAPLPAPQSPAAAKASRAKAVGRVAKPLKSTAARDPGQPRQNANKAKAMPVSPNTEPAPIGDPRAVTPAAQPSPATNGAFGFVQSAVNSLTSATVKLLEWGRIETGSRP